MLLQQHCLPRRVASSRIFTLSIRHVLSRQLLTLAIETSCDDTSVAIVEKHSRDANSELSPTKLAATIYYHEKITANNKAYRGVHPIVSLESHQANLAKLIDLALKSLPPCEPQTASDFKTAVAVNVDDGTTFRRKPDFISVTRGPGMRSNLSTGIDTAKGLAVAWQIPLVGVHHMQAHALTPRLVSALANPPSHAGDPAFPFLSLLVSGGHTMLIHSKSLTNHETLATTADIAIGDAFDKIAREVVPEEVLRAAEDTMYGRILEKFAFPNGAADYEYTPPATRLREKHRHVTKYGWAFGPPLSETRAGAKSNAMEFTFSGLCSAAKRFVGKRAEQLDVDERREMAREAMRVSFEHLATRLVLGLNKMKESGIAIADGSTTLVVSGGVASNAYLKTVLRSFLDIRGYAHVRLLFPPPALCTDNAAMIAWAGIEMFEAGWQSELKMRALRRWSMDPAADDGGILGVGGWQERGRRIFSGEIGKHGWQALLDISESKSCK